MNNRGTESEELASKLKKVFPNRPEIEFFCTLEKVEGWEPKARDLLKSHSNRDQYQSTREKYHADLAEVKASFILGDSLGLEIVGFERRREDQGLEIGRSTCDICARVEDSGLFFEVKARSKEEFQTAPRALRESLRRWQSTADYSVVLEVHGRMKKSTDFNDLGSSLDEYLSSSSEQSNWIYMDDRGFSIRLFPRSDDSIGYSELFDGGTTDDLLKWLFLDKKRDGKLIASMVRQAEQKNADFLMTLIPPQDPAEWKSLVEQGFPDVNFNGFQPLKTRHTRLGNLQGLILFTSAQEFQIILKEDLDGPFPIE